MSRIDDLIKELCPDGVEFRPLGEVGEFVRGNGMPKSDFSEAGVGCIHYGQIYTFYGTWADKTISYVPTKIADKLAKVDPGDLIITNTSENLDDVCKAIAWLGDDQIVTGGHASVLKHSEDPKYISYYLQTDEFHRVKKKYATGTKVLDVSARNLAKIKIPVPPMEVQKEIVKILDAMTELKAELEAELEARRNQYIYYRDQLLTFTPDSNPEVQWMTLGDLGKWYGGGTPSKGNRQYWEHGTIPWVSPKDMIGPTIFDTQDHITESALESSSARLLPPNSVLVVVRSSILDKRLPICFAPSPVALNQDMKALVTDPEISPKFVAHLLRSLEPALLARTRKSGGSVASIEMPRWLKYSVPIPPLEEQKRIVEILDKFDALVNDISIGLPAEIEARRKQYEYYRDKLLTFEEAA